MILHQEVADCQDKRRLQIEARSLTSQHGAGAYRSTQPCIPPGSLNRVPASAGVRAGMSPLPGGR